MKNKWNNKGNISKLKHILKKYPHHHFMCPHIMQGQYRQKLVRYLFKIQHLWEKPLGMVTEMLPIFQTKAKTYFLKIKQWMFTLLPIKGLPFTTLPFTFSTFFYLKSNLPVSCKRIFKPWCTPTLLLNRIQRYDHRITHSSNKTLVIFLFL